MLKSLALAVVITASSLEALAAQEAAGRGQRNRGARAENALSPAEVMNVLDGYAVVQAQAMLQLGEAQYGQFVTRLRRLQEARRRNQQARNGLVQDLRKVAGPQAAPQDEAVVRQALKALRDHDDRAAADMRKAYDALDEVLDARQQARFRIFEENLERRKFDLLMRARQGAAKR